MERNNEAEKIIDLSSKFKNLLLILPTGFGKTKIAIDILKSYGYRDKILIVIPKLVLVDNWKEEIKKWHYGGKVEFTTYVSLHKHIGSWNCIVFDECHHFTERCAEVYNSLRSQHTLCLSGTVKREQYYRIQDTIHPYLYKITMRKAINDAILPDPKILFIPLSLSPSQWREYNKLTNDVNRYKDLYMRKGSNALKTLWLHKAGTRLAWLSNAKTEFVSQLLELLGKYRTLTFCNNIAQTEQLGKNYINSKNKDSLAILNAFNRGSIKHLTACNILNEGMNLKNCQIGIYANLNSSEIIVKQRLGRLLRHKKPLIIIPFFTSTRDEELVNKMAKDYNPDLVKYISLTSGFPKFKQELQDYLLTLQQTCKNITLNCLRQKYDQYYFAVK